MIILQQLKRMIKKYSRAIFLLGNLSEFGREVWITPSPAVGSGWSAPHRLQHLNITFGPLCMELQPEGDWLSFSISYFSE